MSFLVDFRQASLPDLEYVSGFLQTGYIYNTGDSVSGNVMISGGGAGLFIEGELNTETGIIFDKENRRVGIGVSPEASIHIKDKDLYIGEDADVSALELRTANDGILSKIEKNAAGVLYISGDKSVGSSFFYLDNDVVSGRALLLSGISGSGINGYSKSGVLSFGGARGEIDYFNVFVDKKGALPFIVGSGIGSTGREIVVNYDDYCLGEETQVGQWVEIFEDWWAYQTSGVIRVETSPKPSISNDEVLLSGRDRGIIAAGERASLGEGDKHSFVLQSGEVGLLRFETGVYNNFSGEFTVYLKSAGGDTVSDASSFLGTESSGVVISAYKLYNPSVPRQTLFKLYVEESGAGSNYILRRRYGYSFPYYSKIAQSGDNKIGQVILFEGGTNSSTSLNSGFNIVSFTDEGGDGERERGQNFSGPFKYDGSDFMDIILRGGSLYEMGIINRKLYLEEVEKIKNREAFWDIFESGEVRFYFNMNYGSGLTVYDEINGYTGTIIGLDEGHWK